MDRLSPWEGSIYKPKDCTIILKATNSKKEPQTLGTGQLEFRILSLVAAEGRAWHGTIQSDAFLSVSFAWHLHTQIPITNSSHHILRQDNSSVSRTALHPYRPAANLEIVGGLRYSGNPEAAQQPHCHQGCLLARSIALRDQMLNKLLMLGGESPA